VICHERNCGLRIRAPLEGSSGTGEALELEGYFLLGGRPRFLRQPVDLAAYEVYIVDFRKFLKLREDQRQNLRQATVLLIVPPDLMGESEEWIRFPAFGRFALPKRRPPRFWDPASTWFQNLLGQLRGLFNLNITNHRLNAYIRDSFQDIVDTSLLHKQKLEIEELNAKLQEISRVDHLTKLLNRRALLEAFEAEKKRSMRDRWRMKHSARVFADPEAPESSALPEDFENTARGAISEHIGNFACIMVDIDHFKQVNDVRGHLVGDQVLQRFGELVRSGGLFRDNDILGRFGGEEFIILLPETNALNAAIPAERLRQALSKEEFRDEKGQAFQVTISLGIAEFLPEESSSDEMINRADKALYFAKEHGRNQICVYSEALEG